jgi:hypothetical protein
MSVEPAIAPGVAPIRIEPSPAELPLTILCAIASAGLWFVAVVGETLAGGGRGGGGERGDELNAETAEPAENLFSESRIQNPEFRRKRWDDPDSSPNPAAFWILDSESF